MTNKPYTTTEYSIYDKTLYLQRLLFSIDNNMRDASISEEANTLKERLLKQAKEDVDNAITSLTDILEIIGYFPTIREVQEGVQLWKQPLKFTSKQKLMN